MNENLKLLDYDLNNSGDFTSGLLSYDLLNYVRPVLDINYVTPGEDVFSDLYVRPKYNNNSSISNTNLDEEDVSILSVDKPKSKDFKFSIPGVNPQTQSLISPAKSSKKSTSSSGSSVRYSNPKYKKNEWVDLMKEAYRKSGITNEETINNLVKLDALESAWGKSAQGKFNYGNITAGKNYSGSYYQGKDTDADGNPISQKFRNYESAEEYAKDKIALLTRRYDFNLDDSFNLLISKLEGNNSSKYRYAEHRNYGNILRSVKLKLGGTLNIL